MPSLYAGTNVEATIFHDVAAGHPFAPVPLSSVQLRSHSRLAIPWPLTLTACAPAT